MRHSLSTLACLALAMLSVSFTGHANGNGNDDGHRDDRGDPSIQVGVRPMFLVSGMDDSDLKRKLQKCSNDLVRRTKFSIAHRGAPLQFPEHTKEAYDAGARMGAGIVECDVTFTKDGALVCRHDECDLHTTTNIVDTPLNASCTTPWSGAGSAPRCCASDLTLNQFKSLKGKMDASNPAATTAAGYLGGTASWRTDLYNSRGTLLTLKESIALNRKNGVGHTPELKAGNPARVNAVFGSQAKYAQAMIDEFKKAGVNPKDVWAQSFNLDDVLYWIRNEPKFGRQAVYLDDVDPSVSIPPLTVAELRDIRRQGVRIFAPPIPALLAVDDATNTLVPSQYAEEIKGAGLDIITWSFERADLRRGAAFGGFYAAYDPQGRVVKKDSDMYLALDALAQDVGVIGVFSDWPATVSYYASCMGLD
ncbi:MAG TPA: glycerophosphodiester phosphodiesterase family protein [Steroidobacteraceae bacterium]|nr:glycerophosphodiester phosphodiesterase family protein [Steroidobacteraceae bacterium]